MQLAMNAAAALTMGALLGAQTTVVQVEDYVPEADLQMTTMTMGNTTDIMGHMTGMPGGTAVLYALPHGDSINSSLLTPFGIASLDAAGKGVFKLPVPTSIYETLPMGLQLDFVAAVVDHKTGQIEVTPLDSLMLGVQPCEQLNYNFNPEGVPLVAGETLSTQYASVGLTISCDNKTPGNPDKAIIFDSGNPTGEDDDLVTPGFGPNNNVPLGNVMIVAEDDVDLDMDGLVDDPDDEAGGGIITYQFDTAVSFCDITLLDLDDGGGSELRFYLNNALVDTVPLTPGGENSVQVIAGFVEQFDRMEVDFVSSGAVAGFGFVFCPTRINFDTFTAGGSTGLVAGEQLTNQLNSLGLTVSAVNNFMGHPDKAILFDTGNVTGEDDDLATPGPGLNNDTPLGLVLIIAEDDVDDDMDGNVDDPDDEQFGGTMTFQYISDVVFQSAKVLDIDTNESGMISFYDEFDNFITSLAMAPLGDNSVQTLAEEIRGVRRIEVFLSGSGALADLEVCPDFSGTAK